jgi:hypothetical protein
MKKLLAVGLIAAMLTGCGDPLTVKTAEGIKTYPTYGFLNEGNSKSNKVCYELIFGNVAWGIVLVETIIAPVYFFGFSLYEPTRLKASDKDTCGIDN